MTALIEGHDICMACGEIFEYTLCLDTYEYTKQSCACDRQREAMYNFISSRGLAEAFIKFHIESELKLAEAECKPCLPA